MASGRNVPAALVAEPRGPRGGVGIELLGTGGSSANAIPLQEAVQATDLRIVAGIPVPKQIPQLPGWPRTPSTSVRSRRPSA